MFLLQKIVAMLLFPLNLCLQLIAAGLLLLWLGKRQKLGKTLVSTGFILLVLFSSNFFCNFSLGLLEDRYRPLLVEPINDKELASYAGVHWIVVLGGGHTGDMSLPATTRLSERSLSRVVEAIRLHRLLPHTKLVFSGGVVFEPLPEADSMIDAALALGIDKASIVREGASRDTKDQALFIRQLVGTDRFLLVTSAAHMPRAAAMFRKLGVDFIPASCDQRIKESAWAPTSFYPNNGALNRSENAVYEFLGFILAALTGRI